METMKWSGRALKKQSKRRLKQYYWKYVFMTLLVILLTGSSSWLVSGMNPLYGGLDALATLAQEETADKQGAVEGFLSGFFDGFMEEEDAASREVARNHAIVFSSIGILGYAGLALVLVELISIFVLYPMEVGVLRCYNYSYSMKPMLKEVFYCFEHRYKNVVCVLFLRELYIIGWSLLLIVPGVIKSYEYRMVPHIMADDPGITAKDAFALSKAMMKGQKWRTFLLDLSFLGWRILSTMTLGLVGVFYLEPYQLLTRVGLYRKLAGIENAVANVYLAGEESDYSKL